MTAPKFVNKSGEEQIDAHMSDEELVQQRMRELTNMREDCDVDEALEALYSGPQAEAGSDEGEDSCGEEEPLVTRQQARDACRWRRCCVSWDRTSQRSLSRPSQSWVQL